MKNEWIENTRKRTFDILKTVKMDAFSLTWGGQLKACPMRSLTSKYGYITRDDALQKEWRIFDADNNRLPS